MSFEFWPAILAGVMGGLLMSGMKVVMGAAGVNMRLDMDRMWGTLVGASGDSARRLGFLIHLLVSAAVGLMYAIFFNLVGATDDLWLWGLVGGGIHWVVAGLAISAMPMVHPSAPEQQASPGAFAREFGGTDVAAFLMGHLVYGLTVGILYALFHPAGGLSIAF